ncbi:MAG: hypothetical protein CM15mP77_0860 [Synechococcus sp.]|nr:MAG: hypothetical protein CM15mP77_0860 [Synechococcus sp.]
MAIGRSFEESFQKAMRSRKPVTPAGVETDRNRNSVKRNSIDCCAPRHRSAFSASAAPCCEGEPMLRFTGSAVLIPGSWPNCVASSTLSSGCCGRQLNDLSATELLELKQLGFSRVARSPGRPKR